MAVTADDVKTTTETTLMKRLFIALQYPAAPEAAMMDQIAEGSMSVSISGVASTAVLG